MAFRFRFKFPARQLQICSPAQTTDGWILIQNFTFTSPANQKIPRFTPFSGENDDFLTLFQRQKEVTMTTHQSSLTWVQYYQAVKQGDLETVKNAHDKDFRISLTKDKSALELAALNGHGEMFDHFVRSVDKTKDADILVKALESSFRGGHPEIAQKIVDLLGTPDSIKRLLDSGGYSPYSKCLLNVAAMLGENLNCVKIIHNIIKLSKKDAKSYIRYSFSKIGSEDILRLLMEEMGVSESEEVANILSTESYFVDIALNNVEPVLKATKRNKRQWHTRQNRLTPMDVAALYGRLDILKKMVEKMDYDKLLYFQSNMKSTIALALQKNRTEILKYLIEEDVLDDLEAPCYYPGFEMNEAFYYLHEVTKDMMKKIPKKLEIREYEGKKDFLDLLETMFSRDYWPLILPQPSAMGDFIEYLVGMWGNNPKRLKLDALLMQELAKQNTDAALALGKVATRNPGCKMADFHKYFRTAMYNNRQKDGKIPSAVVLEILLDVLGSRRTCQCEKKLNPMEMFLVPEYKRTPYEREDVWSKICQPEFERSEHPESLSLFTRKMDAIVQLLVNHGYEKPTSGVVIGLVKHFFGSEWMSDVGRWPLYAARILALLKCCRVDLKEIQITSLPGSDEAVTVWFAQPWECRDEFLTKLLIALSKNHGPRTVEIECLSAYFVKPKMRRRHFLNCLAQTGLSVSDVHITGGKIKETPQFLEVSEALSARRVPTLIQCSLVAIHQYCLTLANESSTYVTVDTLANRVGQSLPESLKKCLHFSEVFETLHENKAPCSMNCGIRDMILRSGEEGYVVNDGNDDDDEEESLEGDYSGDSDDESSSDFNESFFSSDEDPNDFLLSDSSEEEEGAEREEES